MSYSSLPKAYPQLAQEWHPIKNSPLTPENVKPHSGQKVWWLCKNGHEWQAAINSRSHGENCPYCLNKKACPDNSLTTLNPELAQEWHPRKNGKLTPNDVLPGSGKKVWWLCQKGHEWQAIINNRNQGKKCPYCTNKKVGKDNCLATLNPELAKEWHPTKNTFLTPETVTSGSTKKVWWLCKVGHEWQSVIYSRKVSNCPICVREKG
jgi:Probable Zinc-ribbon domain